MSKMPLVEKFMTPMPHTIPDSMPIKEALKVMKEYKIRHLPVVNSGKLVGVLSDADAKLGSGIQGVKPLQASDLMMPDPYSVSPETAIDDIVIIMAEQKFRCVIVEDKDGKIVGIFTDSDALRVLGETLRAHYDKH